MRAAAAQDASNLPFEKEKLGKGFLWRRLAGCCIPCSSFWMNLDESLLAIIARLTEELAEVRRAAATSAAEAAVEREAFKALIQELLAKLEGGKRKKKELEAPPISPDPPFVPPELNDRPQPPPKPEKEEKPVRKPRTPKPKPDLPTTQDPTLRPDHCSHCGGARLQQKDLLETELTDYVRGYVQRRLVTRMRCRCLDCGRVTVPPVPNASLPKTHYTAAFVAYILYSKLAMHLPWNRIMADLKQQGFSLPSSTLNDLTQRALDSLSVIVKVLWKQLLAGSYMHSDATGLPVVRSDKTETHLGQFFVFGWENMVVFRYQPDKEGKTFKRMVEYFEGVLILDASGTHNLALELPRIRWAGCNAHGLRKFREAKESDPVLGAEGERWVAAMYDREREGRDQGMTGAALLAWRQQEIAPIAEKFKKWLAMVHPTTVPKTPLREATNYYANYWPALTRFLRDPSLPLDNNFAERNLRGVALGRSNWFYAGSDEAAERLAVGYSLVQTAKAEGLDILAYLTWALEQVLKAGPEAPAEMFTPAAYKKAQQSGIR